MAFDPTKDKVLKSWQCPETGLMVSINQYDKSQPKLQIGPRVFTKKDGKPGAPVKAGRLSYEDVDWLFTHIDEIREELGQRVTPE